MSTMVVTTKITHKYLMGKTKFWLAHDYLDLLDHADKLRRQLEHEQSAANDLLAGISKWFYGSAGQSLPTEIADAILAFEIERAKKDGDA